MRIAQIASIHVSVPPQKYGGTELIVSLLTEELVRRGHEITLYAPGDSKTSAKLKSYYPRALGFGSDTPEMHLAAASFAIQDAEEFDVIHNHAGIWGLKAAQKMKTPLLTTLHNDLMLRGSKEFEEFKETGHFAAISKNQKERLSGLNFAGVVYNAIEVDKYPFLEKKGDYLLFFGNLIHEKGVDIALRAAQDLKLKLIMSGKVNPGEQKEFFEKNIAPKIDGKEVVLYDLVDPKTKEDLLAKAKCLFFPVIWNEPFGLAMLEAMACGTPVVALRHGSVPEVINDGVTGYVVDTYPELLEAVKKVENISPQACRQHVIENFSVAKMADGYESLYKKILAS
jgi:glycosyltransferase involved in cell wall biosynthesis